MPTMPHAVPAMPELFSPKTFLGEEMERMKQSADSERGAIYTRPEVVDFILDLANYTTNQPLWSLRLLEPSFGSGDFLLPAVRRLLDSAQRDGKKADELENAIRAVELHRETFERARQAVVATLREHDVGGMDSEALADAWLINGDFLLENLDGHFDVVAGNPPYVRQELIPVALLTEYRRRYKTLYDRADLYVPFIEQSLRLLKPGGALGFICSDRWMKNRYGGPLRSMITTGYSLKYYIDMVGTNAFQSDVIAYPAITVIERSPAACVRMAHRPEVSSASLNDLRSRITGSPRHFNGTVVEAPFAISGSEPWLMEADARPSLDLVRRLESDFPSLEEAGCNVGIGVATGADKVFIGQMDELDVENERKLPLVMTRDIQDGVVNWRGFGVVNPFEEDGKLADFAAYPRFAAFMQRHSSRLKERHCAQKGKDSWYRTIDRITPSLARTPKLLIPDIKGAAHIVYEDGRLYPHHNLYHITSKDWPLRELGSVLMAGIAHLFVRAYSTKMHGGTLRFQAQYLRRIRLPVWQDITAEDRVALSEAGAARDVAKIRSVVARSYRLNDEEQTWLHANP